MMIQPDTAMQEYVKKAIENYVYFTSQKLKQGDVTEAIDCFNRWKYPEMLLLQGGWIRIYDFPRSRVIEAQHFATYFSREYNLKVTLHFNESAKLLATDWYFDNYPSIRLIYTGSKHSYQFVVPVGTLALYSILNYQGNIEAAIFYLDQPIKDAYFKNSPFTIKHVSSNIAYKSPPPPIDYSTAYSKEKFSELKSEIDALSKEIDSLKQTTSVPAAQKVLVSDIHKTQITDSTVRNQADGRYNQEYSQAHYTFLNECQSHNYFNNTGIPIGYYCDTPHSQPNSKSENNLIYYQGETHLITVAPTGSGKLTAVQIPVLMEYTGSMVVIDPKGQCAAISARQRIRLGQEVIVINPFEILKEEFKEVTKFHGCNPLAVLNKEDNNFVADVSALAEALVVGDDVGNSDPYWSNSARDLIACLIMYVCCNDKEINNRHLPRVRELLTLDSESLAELMIEISKNKFKPMAQKAMRFTREESSNASVISTALSNTLFLDDPKLVDNLKCDDFRFDNLKNKDKKTTVYIILPAKFLLAYSQWFRLLITSGLDTLMSTHKKADKNVLFMLDEFPTLGRLSSIETAIGLARGYGIQIWMFLQDIHQLNHLYKDKAESFLANTGMQQYFIPNDIVTAERISRRMGNTTLIDEKVTRELSDYGFDVNNMPTNVEISHKERPLNYPIEILSFHQEIQLVFFSRNANVVVMDKNHYYDDGKYRDGSGIPLYDKDPYYDG